MDAVKYLKDRVRMCNSYKGNCNKCKLSKKNNGTNEFCSNFIKVYPEKDVEIVKQWSKSHPRKTILDDFREKYPDAPLINDTYPLICPYDLGYKEIIRTTRKCLNCPNEQMKCWKTPLEEVE